jgi:ribosomal subunit interface protein
MQLQMTVRHGTVNDGIRASVETKITRLGRRLADDTLVEVVLDRERNPSIADDHVVEAEVHLKGSNVLARAAAPTYEVAADRVVDSLTRQIERLRDKQVHEPRRRGGGPEHESVPVETIDRSVTSSDGG